MTKSLLDSPEPTSAAVMRRLRSGLVLFALSLGVAGLAAAPTALAAYPGVNGAIAFTSTQDRQTRHVFITAPTGIVDLTGASSPAAETRPRFSPDGREIAFTRGAPGLPNTEIFVMSADGKQRTQLTNTPTGNADPTWSPDGTMLAFVSDRDHETPNIFIMRTDGTGLRQITHDAAGKSELAWSPKGDQIAFVREPVGGGDREIYSIKPDGSGLKDLSNDPNNSDLDPAWSPDGTKIAYSGPFHPNRESVGADLWIMNANGNGRRPLHHESNGYSDGAFPAWSPDGTTIAFTANNGSGYYHLWSVPASGGQNSSLVTNTVPGGNPLEQEVDWQPRPTSKAPRTLITAARVNARQRTATFAFRGTGPATGYRCELRLGKRKAAFKACSSAKTYEHLKRGAYTFAVIAFAPGERYGTPATRRFTIS